jgi:hypothetical protein
MKIRYSLSLFILGFIILYLSPSLGEASQGSYVWTKAMGGASSDEGLLPALLSLKS